MKHIDYLSSLRKKDKGLVFRMITEDLLVIHYIGTDRQIIPKIKQRLTDLGLESLPIETTIHNIKVLYFKVIG
jgi:hypothetical protein